MLLRGGSPRISALKRGNYTYPYHHRPPCPGSMFLPWGMAGEGTAGQYVRDGHAQVKLPNTDAALDAVHCCRIHGDHTTHAHNSWLVVPSSTALNLYLTSGSSSTSALGAFISSFSIPQCSLCSSS
ncbi:hypothetical protein CGRA01v4_01732 [Colletotrichum graminicola]|nr:hypothetical protein CGRA01v4_01732 [Colletotrichum graminicola]